MASQDLHESGNNDSATRASVSEGAGQNVLRGKAYRQNSAEQRARLKPLRQALQKTEKQLERLQTQLAALQTELADPAIYEAEQRERLAEVVRNEGALKAELDEVEELWMEQQEALDDAS